MIADHKTIGRGPVPDTSIIAKSLHPTRAASLLNEHDVLLSCKESIKLSGRQGDSPGRRGGRSGQGSLVRPLASLLDRFYGVVLRRRTAQGLLDGARVHREPVGRWLGRRGQAISSGLASLERLTRNLEIVGRDLKGVIVHHDKDSVYTSYAWLQRVLLEENGRLSYAEHGAKDNPHVESFWGRFKTENAEVLLACETESEVASVVDDRLAYFNRARRHSALGWLPEKPRPLGVVFLL